MLEGELVCEVAGQGHGDGHESEREVDGLSTVAPVSLALAHEGVVLLEDGLVAIVLVLDVSAASDDSLVSTN